MKKILLVPFLVLLLSLPSTAQVRRHNKHQIDGVNLSKRTPINFLDTPEFDWTNPAAGNLSLAIKTASINLVTKVTGVLPVGNGGTGTTTLTFPSGTDTLVGRATTDTLTNKTLDVEATGNNVTTVPLDEFPAAVCIAATATLNWDDSPLLAEPAAACIAGTNITYGVADFDDTTDEGMQFSFVLPTGWTGNIDLDLWWHGTNIVNDVVWGFQTICVAVGETFDPTFNTAQTVTDTAAGTANQRNRATISNVTTTGCAAEERIFLQFFRDANNGSDNFVGDARLVSTRLTLRRTQ